MRDMLPSAGVFRVDTCGIVRAHTSVLNMGRSRALGRNFFEEVAPCTNCAEFRGRFEAILTQGGGTESFTFRIRYPWVQAEVRVRIFACNGRGAWILIADPTSAAEYEASSRAPWSAEDPQRLPIPA